MHFSIYLNALGMSLPSMHGSQDGKYLENLSACKMPKYGKQSKGQTTSHSFSAEIVIRRYGLA
jgi:hypothetical protein